MDLDALRPRLEGLTTASLVDAMARRHRHRAHILDLVSPSPDRVLFGSAATVAHLPHREDVMQDDPPGFARLFHEAVGDHPAGKVLVLSSGGLPDAAVGGGKKLSRVTNLDMAGVLSDGRLRDFHELRAYGFATWCNGETTKASGGDVMPHAADVAVSIRGVTVFPGDMVYADRSGAVVMPAKDVAWCIEEAHRIEEADHAATEQIRHEDPAEVLGHRAKRA